MNIVGLLLSLFSKNKSTVAIENFLTYVEQLSNSSSTRDRTIEGFDGTEFVLMSIFVADTREMVEYNEGPIGLENILSNLYEIGFNLDKKAIDLASIAIKLCGLNYADWHFIEELDTSR